MRKIDKRILLNHNGTTKLPVDWDSTYYFKNKEKAKRVATKLNKHYTAQLEQLNDNYSDLLQVWRTYWLFLKPFDQQQIKGRMFVISDILVHALSYQDQFFNTPADISRATHEMAGVCDSLELYATKRKDIPLQHQIRIIKTRIIDDYNRNPGTNQGEDQPKRAAFRAANG
jgi:hypothetical protein